MVLANMAEMLKQLKQPVELSMPMTHFTAVALMVGIVLQEHFQIVNLTLHLPVMF
jgi:hypothetical protein